MIDITKFNSDELSDFIYHSMRAETYENPRVYLKGIRACLIELGFPEEFVEGLFYDLACDIYNNTID